MKTILNKFSFQYHFNNTGPVNKWTLKQERYVNVKKKNTLSKLHKQVSKKISYSVPGRQHLRFS